MTVASKTLVWRFPWAEIDPAVCDRAVKDALGAFPGSRLLKLGPPAPARARTYVVGFPLEIVTSSVEAFEDPPTPLDGKVYGRFVMVADAELGAGAVLEAKRNRGIYSLMQRLVDDVGRRLGATEARPAQPSIPAAGRNFSSFADVLAHARAAWPLEHEDEDSFEIAIGVGGDDAIPVVEIVSFEAWSETWIVFWCTVCDADAITAEEAMEKNADLTFATLAKDGDLMRVCWSCPVSVLGPARFDELVLRIGEEADTLAAEIGGEGEGEDEDG